MKQWIRIDFVLHGRAGLSRVLDSEVPTSWVRRDIHGNEIETVATVDVAHMSTCRYELYNATDWYMGRPIAEMQPSVALREAETVAAQAKWKAQSVIGASFVQQAKAKITRAHWDDQVHEQPNWVY